VRSIITYDGNLDAAQHGMSVAVELEDAIDLSRGEMLVSPGNLPQIARAFRANVVWMHEDPLRVGASYLAKHSTRTVRATVRAIRHRVDIHTMQPVEAAQISMNDIAEVEFETNRPIFFDNYRENRDTGNLILIDPLSNATLGAAMIECAIESEWPEAADSQPVVVHLPRQEERARELVESLRSHGKAVVNLDDEFISTASLAGAVRAVQLAGAIGISSRESFPLNEIRAFVDAERVVELGAEEKLESVLKRFYLE
jgi:bifunctional enzyme CysN/CysC/sulfate adenylyltransferase subunit 1